ncbi:hypothetical protein BPJM79_10120 [Bacillus pumilus]
MTISLKKRMLMWILEIETINREKHGEKLLPLQNKEETKEIKVSTTESEIGYYVKGEREKSFAYSFHTACDSKGFIFGSLVTGGNVHDTRMLDSLVKQVTEKIGKLNVDTVDAECPAYPFIIM